MSKERFKITPFAGLILRKGDKVLLMKRAASAISGGYYAFPGGGVDGEETIRAATIREAQEELGVQIHEEDLEFVHVMHVRMENGQEYINFYFETRSWKGELRVMEPHKCDGVAWFSINDLPETIMQTHKQVIEMIKNDQGFSEFGWKK